MTGYARCMVKKVKPLEQANAELIAALEEITNELDNHPSHAAREHYSTFVTKAKLLISKHKAQWPNPNKT